MVSIVNKIGIFTMFSSMVLARQLSTPTAEEEVGFGLTELLTSLQNSINEINDEHDAMNNMIIELQSQVGLLEGKQMTGNYFYQNAEPIAVFQGEDDRKVLLSFDVPMGETLDFLANVTTDHREKQNDKFRLDLVQDGEVVASSVDHGNKKWDNLSFALQYKAKMEAASTFEVVAQAYSIAHRIQESQLQIGYKTYGEGLELTLL